MLDYLAPRFNGPITIGEVLGGGPNVFGDLHYPEVAAEYKSSKVDLVDFTQEGKS